MFNLPSSDHFTVVVHNRGALTEFLEPEQLELRKAGGAKHVHQVRMMSEKNPDMVVVKVDMRNAHNEVSRLLCWKHWRESTLSGTCLGMLQLVKPATQDWSREERSGGGQVKTPGLKSS